MNKDRVRRYMKRTYGNRAFFENGKIKKKYLRKAKKRVESGAGKDENNLKKAIQAALNR